MPAHPVLIPEPRLLLPSHSPMHPLPCTGQGGAEAETALREGRGCAGDEAEVVLQNCGERQNLM